MADANLAELIDIRQFRSVKATPAATTPRRRRRLQVASTGSEASRPAAQRGKAKRQPQD